MELYLPPAAVADEHVQLPPVLSLSARPAELEAVSFDGI